MARTRFGDWVACAERETAAPHPRLGILAACVLDATCFFRLKSEGAVCLAKSSLRANSLFLVVVRLPMSCATVSGATADRER